MDTTIYRKKCKDCGAILDQYAVSCSQCGSNNLVMQKVIRPSYYFIEVGFFVFAMIVSCLSIVAFFGDAFANTGGTAIPNMFHLMFGGSGTYSGYVIIWKQYGGMTTIFAFQMAIMILSIISFIYYGMASNSKTNGIKIFLAVLTGICSIVALILSFCTLGLTNIDPYGEYGITLGFGPIFYSILQIISVVFIVVGIVYYFYKKDEYDRNTRLNEEASYYNNQVSSSVRNSIVHNVTPTSSNSNTQTSPSVSNQNLNSQNKTVPTKQTLSENEKIELLQKYKSLLDSGIITQEEFETKKKEIL